MGVKLRSFLPLSERELHGRIVDERSKQFFDRASIAMMAIGARAVIKESGHISSKRPGFVPVARLVAARLEVLSTRKFPAPRGMFVYVTDTHQFCRPLIKLSKVKNPPRLPYAAGWEPKIGDTVVLENNKAVPIKEGSLGKCILAFTRGQDVEECLSILQRMEKGEDAKADFDDFYQRASIVLIEEGAHGVVKELRPVVFEGANGAAYEQVAARLQILSYGRLPKSEEKDIYIIDIHRFCRQLPNPLPVVKPATNQRQNPARAEAKVNGPADAIAHWTLDQNGTNALGQRLKGSLIGQPELERGRVDEDVGVSTVTASIFCPPRPSL